MSDTTIPSANPRRHARAVRFGHLLLVAMVAVQLTTGSVMATPEGGVPGDAWFAVHVLAGLGAVAAVSMLWLTVLLRPGGGGTAPAALFPWFSASRRRAAWLDLRGVIVALRARRLPRAEETAAGLAPAVHGLGLLAATALVATGALGWYGGLAPLLGIHAALVTVLWIYLGGHAGVALFHQLAGEGRIAHMFLPWRRDR
ncbi:cytochrome b/b6 domain-containing protein [Rhodovarius lipocyclicus]|uniref:cytochrome b/b6 domain-containing protein n=1 Tax=Rhodovarius lipocyclicus TaxID=268410 RepID=UPI00135BE636|nr:cytochrome b/b6 domain-containing protein [Rhodovarius lipocyclicus]